MLLMLLLRLLPPLLLLLQRLLPPLLPVLPASAVASATASAAGPLCTPPFQLLALPLLLPRGAAGVAPAAAAAAATALAAFLARGDAATTAAADCRLLLPLSPRLLPPHAEKHRQIISLSHVQALIVHLLCQNHEVDMWFTRVVGSGNAPLTRELYNNWLATHYEATCLAARRVWQRPVAVASTRSLHVD